MIGRPLALTITLAAAAEAQDIQPMAPPGAPADTFPKPDRPVAEILSPEWALEKRRNKADEVGQVAPFMKIREGQTDDHALPGCDDENAGKPIRPFTACQLFAASLPVSSLGTPP